MDKSCTLISPWLKLGVLRVQSIKPKKEIPMEFTSNPTNDAEMALSAYRSNMKRTRIPTGLAELDEVLGGGFVPSFVLLHGKPSVGKTTFARQLAYQMAEKDKVTYGSYTHDVNDLVCKALSMYSYIQNPLMAMTADEFASKNG